MKSKDDIPFRIVLLILIGALCLYLKVMDIVDEITRKILQ